jgi:hypothetical protein
MSVASAGNTVPTTFMIQATNHTIKLLDIEFPAQNDRARVLKPRQSGIQIKHQMAFGIRTATSVKKT